jgi:hypothetical protein
MERWPTIWKELRENILSRPKCPEHPDHPCVRTLARGVPNDILAVGEEGILARSHKTMNEDFIPARRFETWWNHLDEHGSASLRAGAANNPHRWRSRIVGALLAAGLADRVRVNGDMLERVGSRPADAKS